MEDQSEELRRNFLEFRSCICSSAQPLRLFGNDSSIHDDSLDNATTSNHHDGGRGENYTSNDTFCSPATGSVRDSEANEYYRNVEELLYTRVAVVICAVGLVGNVCNLFVLIPQGRHCSMGRIEKFAYWGLVSLSISDACFCLLVIPHAFLERDPYSLHSVSFSVLYAVYSTAMLNVFSMASTWLTVILAIGRYLAICHPFKAREFIGRTVAKRAGWLI